MQVACDRDDRLDEVVRHQLRNTVVGGKDMLQHAWRHRCVDVAPRLTMFAPNNVSLDKVMPRLFQEHVKTRACVDDLEPEFRGNQLACTRDLLDLLHVYV